MLLSSSAQRLFNEPASSPTSPGASSSSLVLKSPFAIAFAASFIRLIGSAMFFARHASASMDIGTATLVSTIISIVILVVAFVTRAIELSISTPPSILPLFPSIGQPSARAELSCLILSLFSRTALPSPSSLSCSSISRFASSASILSRLST